MFAALLFTGIVFVMVVYAQAMKVEIPLSFGMVRGHGVRWPLSFFYTSVIPVILVSALIANFQLLGSFLNNKGISLLGTFNSLGQPVSGFVYWVRPINLVRTIIQQNTIFIGFAPYLQALFYILFLMIGAMIFSMFWVQTAGMDARSQAKQMMSSGLQIPGFRRDERVLERLLNRYIWPLTIMGGLGPLETPCWVDRNMLTAEMSGLRSYEFLIHIIMSRRSIHLDGSFLSGIFCRESICS